MRSSLFPLLRFGSGSGSDDQIRPDEKIINTLNCTEGFTLTIMYFSILGHKKFSNKI